MAFFSVNAGNVDTATEGVGGRGKRISSSKWQQRSMSMQQETTGLAALSNGAGQAASLFQMQKKLLLFRQSSREAEAGETAAAPINIQVLISNP